MNQETLDKANKLQEFITAANRNLATLEKMGDSVATGNDLTAKCGGNEVIIQPSSATRLLQIEIEAVTMRLAKMESRFIKL